MDGWMDGQLGVRLIEGGREGEGGYTVSLWVFHEDSCSSAVVVL